jgi:hypothetical protein
MAGLAVSRNVAEIYGFLEADRIDLWRINQVGGEQAFGNSPGKAVNE